MANSKQVTTDLMAYLRCQRRMYLLATEVKYNRCRSDVLALDNKAIVEFEVKISKADFLKDFDKTLVLGYRKWKTSIPKHAMYTGSVKTDKKYFVPHYFYFVVPMELVDVVKEKCKSHPSYGIVGWSMEIEGHIRLIKSPRLLTNDPPNKRVVQKILQRATSELVKLRTILYSPGIKVPDEEEDDDELEQEELSLPGEGVA
jgi:hypothetical protein